MKRREFVMLGIAASIIWTVAIVWLPQTLTAPFIPLNTVLMMAFFPVGLVMLFMIGRISLRRFFDDDLIDGSAFIPGSPSNIDQRVLANTCEQIVLAMALWPFVLLTLGGLTVLFLAVGFALARIAYWAGYHMSPLLRAFGFGATFFPTVLGAFWALYIWIG